MSSLTVTVLTPHGRRQNVNVGPNMTLLQVLEEVCKKYEFKSEEHCLKHHNKKLDLTQMFRFSGLPNKCLLEMEECNQKREDSEVVICIQFQNGTRQQGQFYPNQTLKDVIQTLNSDCLKDNPVVIYMRTELYGNMFESTTLKSLGITKGRAMFRVLNKKPEDLKKQANVYIPIERSVSSLSEEGVIETKLKPKNEQNVKKSVEITSEKIRSVIPKNEKNEQIDDDESNTEKEKEDVDVENVSKKSEYDWDSSVGRKMNEKIVQEEENNQEDVEMIEEAEIFVLGERNAVIFSMDSAQKVVDDIPDSFFDLTIDDLKMILRDLRKEAIGNEDAPLLTAKLREIEETSNQLRRLAKYKRSVIRIQFPDRMVLQGTFNSTDKIEDVYNFVRNYLKNSDLNFHLFTTPRKNILDRNITLIEANCVPTTILHFEENGNKENTNENHDLNKKSYLKDDLKETSANGAILAASKSRGLAGLQLKDERKEDNQPGPSSSSDQRRTACTGAIPKKPKPDSFKKSAATKEASGKVPKWFMSTNK